jgi:uncharacterized protein DUF4388
VVELKGSLSGIGLHAIVQLIGEVHHSGNLDLRKDGRCGTLAFDNGRLVAAECGEHHGLQALADCVLEMADGEFTFVEGIPSLDRTLDLGGATLAKLLDRISSGELQLVANGVNGSGDDHDTRGEAVCPLLGFADDRSRHYSRATALHRCYAGGAPSLVNPTEQRELCLSEQFASCPRFRTADRAQPAVVLPLPESTRRIDAPTVVTRPPARPSPTQPPAEEPVATAQSEIPPGVATRLAASSNLHLAPEPDATVVQPLPPQPGTQEQPTKRPSRGVMPIVGGAVLGFLLVGLLMLVVLPAMRPAPAPQPTAIAFEQLARPTPILATAATQAIPTPVVPRPTIPATAAPVQAKPVVQPRTTASTAPSDSLVDVRFAAGPIANWIDNPPYAAWSDGAYRLRARDAARFVAVGIPTDQFMGDVVVSATFRKTGGPPGGGYGLIIRDQGPEPRDGVSQEMTAYVMETGDLGEYGVWRRDGDHWVDLVPWMRSSSVRSGGSPNELTVRAVGDQLTFSVNGAEVANVTDDALITGRVGLFVGGDNNEVAVDHFSVQKPD